MRISNPRIALTAALALFLGGASTAGDYFGLDQVTGDLYSIDAGSGSATNLGTISGGPPFGFHSIDRSPNGKIYASAPGLITGYSIYEIDPLALTATLLHSVASGQSGNVGMAVDPSGNSVWVAGFVALSLKVTIEEIDLATGSVTAHGDTAGNLWGLAFDGNGNLYSSAQIGGGSDPPLLLIDQVDAGNSSLVGVMSGVDMSLGLDLASNRTDATVTVLSRNADSLHAVDTATAAATLIATVPSAGPVFSISEDDPCGGDATTYGSGCQGSLGITPSLDVDGCPEVGNNISLNVEQGLGSAPALLFFGLAQGSTAVGGGCTLLVTPVLPAFLSFNLGGSGPGNGSASIGGPLPASAAGFTFTAQVFVIDSANPIGAAATNGVQVDIP